MTRHICLHGAESTGKSTLAARLALRLGGLIVPEYGRTYAEANGTDLDETDLLAIFDAASTTHPSTRSSRRRATRRRPSTASGQAWAIMLLGRRLPEIDHWGAVADLYLVPAMDLPWQEDGTRLFGSELARAQFMDIAIGELDRRRLSWTWIEGEGDARVANALAAIQAAGLE